MSETNAYRHFALLYDDLMAEAPYDQWVAYLKDQRRIQKVEGNRVLDLGCGTGTLTLQLQHEGLEATGVDLSDDMLSIAQTKATQARTPVTFYQQDMRDLNLPGSFDTIVAFCDALNYLESFADVEQTFKSVYDHLTKNGLFLFDVHSVYKIDHVFNHASFCSADEDISYLWDCFSGPDEHSVYHELSFFVKEAPGLYRRYDETHFQRTFPLQDYAQSLEAAGFTVSSVTGDFSEDPPTETAERWLFAARKSS